jgi:hypothetical protein
MYVCLVLLQLWPSADYGSGDAAVIKAREQLC